MRSCRLPIHFYLLSSKYWPPNSIQIDNSHILIPWFPTKGFINIAVFSNCFCIWNVWKFVWGFFLHWALASSYKGRFNRLVRPGALSVLSWSSPKLQGERSFLGIETCPSQAATRFSGALVRIREKASPPSRWMELAAPQAPQVCRQRPLHPPLHSRR